MPTPGEPAAGCQRCGATTVQVGWDTAVVGVHCENCNLTVVTDGAAMNIRELQDAAEEWNPDEWEPSGAPYGPDPWG